MSEGAFQKKYIHLVEKNYFSSYILQSNEYYMVEAKVGCCRITEVRHMAKEIIHRCPQKCPWHKNCFVCKTQGEVKEDVVVLHKCMITKEDIQVHLGQSPKILCVE